MCVPVMRKATEDADAAFIEYLGTEKPVDMYIWSDSSPEWKRAVRKLLLPHGRATPGMHQANGYCERTVRRVVEGTRALLENAGIPQCFWSLAVRHWCFVHNTEVVDGESPWNRRHGKGNYEGLLLAWGQTVGYLPDPDIVKALPKFEPRGQVGVLMGYYLQPGAH